MRRLLWFNVFQSKKIPLQCHLLSKPENKKAISMFDIAFHPYLPRTSIKRKATWIKSRFDAAIFNGNVLNYLANELRSKFHMINKIIH